MISDKSYSSESDLSENPDAVQSASIRSQAYSHIQGKILSASRHSNMKDSQGERNTRIKRMEFLPEVDDELDYDEDELPSVIQRDHATQDIGKARSSSRFLNKKLSALTSPREEGEEYSEDDEESYSQSDLKRAFRSDKGRLRAEREEGEASSEDERRYSHPTRHTRTGRSPTTASTTTNLLLDEAHYRSRLQERYERRESKRSRTENEMNTRVSSTTVQAQFAMPHSKMDISPYSNVEYTNPTGPTPSDLDRLWRVQRSGSSDKGLSRHRISEEASGVVIAEYSDDRRSSRKRGKFDKKISDQESRSKSKRSDHDRSPKSTQVPRSYSASYLGHELSSEQFGDLQDDTDQRMLPESDTKRSKSKKSKRDRSERDHERNEYRMHKKSSKLPKVHSYYELGHKISEVKKAGIDTGLEERENYTSASSRSSSPSSLSASHSPSPNTRPSEPRKHRSRHGSLHSKTNLDYPHRKHKHKYQRDVRESAPPPDAARTQSMVDTTSRILPPSYRAEKQDKHKVDDSNQLEPRIAMKRIRHLPEDLGERVTTDQRNVESGSRRSTSRTRLPGSDGKDRRTIDTATNSDSVSRGAFRQSHSAIAGYPHAFSSDGSSGSESGDSSDRSDHDVGDENTNSTHGESKKPSDQDAPISRRIAPLPIRSTNPYRLYSESESGDEQDNDHVEGTAFEDDDKARRSQKLDELNGDDDDGAMVNNAGRLMSPIHNKPFYFPSIQGCRSVEEFECLNRIEEGTYGVVYRARDKKTNEIVALKRLKMEKERDGFPITSLREINTLMKAQHENIVTVREIVVGSNMDKIYLVMDYVEHDLKSLMEVMNGPFSVGEVKCLLVQLLRAVRHLHDNWILHRDLKTSNLLLSHQGILKVGDFGLAREYGSPLKHYTEVVVTLWYRAPELLLGTKQYTCPIDMWSVGCIFAEFLLQRPLFPGKGEVDELNIIFRDLGTPTERIWPGVSQLPGMKKCVFTDYPYNQLRRRFTEKQISDQGFDLLNSFLTYCPEKRITAEKALTHAYFNERPRAIHPSMFPSWPAKSEGAVAVRKASPRPPAGGGALAAAAAAMAAATAATTATGGSGRVRYQPPAPPMGGQRFYSSMGIGGGPDSRSGTAIGSGDLLSSGPDKGFLLRF